MPKFTIDIVYDLCPTVADMRSLMLVIRDHLKLSTEPEPGNT